MIELSATEGTFEPIPCTNMQKNKVKPVREICYICGPSGAGKSTWCAAYIRNFRKLFPDVPVYVLSRLTDDKVIDDLDVIRITCDETLIESPIDIHSEVASGSLFIFDDCDTITNMQVRAAVSQLMFDILETGRHRNIYCLITSHAISGRSRIENAKIFNEIHRLVLFPGGGNRVAMQRVLEHHIGLSACVAKRILTLKTRWICVGKNYPQYLLCADSVQAI